MTLEQQIIEKLEKTSFPEVLKSIEYSRYGNHTEIQQLFMLEYTATKQLDNNPEKLYS